MNDQPDAQDLSLTTQHKRQSYIPPAGFEPAIPAGARPLGSSVVYTQNCNFAIVFYGCEIWSLTWREERKLIVLENRVLRGIFGTKGDEVTGDWRKLHNEELNELYCSPIIVQVIK